MIEIFVLVLGFGLVASTLVGVVQVYIDRVHRRPVLQGETEQLESKHESESKVDRVQISGIDVIRDAVDTFIAEKDESRDSGQDSSISQREEFFNYVATLDKSISQLYERINHFEESQELTLRRLGITLDKAMSQMDEKINLLEEAQNLTLERLGIKKTLYKSKNVTIEISKMKDTEYELAASKEVNESLYPSTMIGLDQKPRRMFIHPSNIEVTVKNIDEESEPSPEKTEQERE